MFPEAMELSRRLPWRGAFLLALGACAPEPVDSAYSGSGRLLALSGGDAGAQAACHTCHGLNGEGDGDLAPRLAGLDRGYLARQLILFGEGQRSHARMQWIARHFDMAERDRVAAYYAQMAWPAPRPSASAAGGCETPGQAGAARLYQAGDTDRGIAACASCHGAAGQGVGAGNPALAGQPAPYLADQLRKWQEGERYGDAQGLMRDAARQLADAEIAPLAAYVASLSGSPDDPVSPAKCLPRHRPDPRNGA